MKKVYDLNLDYNLISNRKSLANVVYVGEVGSLFSRFSTEFCKKKIKVVIKEKDFSLFGVSLVDKLKKIGASVDALIVKKDGELKKSCFIGVDVVIAVGDDKLLSSVRCDLSKTFVPCYALPTTPYLERLLSHEVDIEMEGITKESPIKSFEKVFVDEQVILNAEDDSFAESYISVMSKLTALIDYKINCFLLGDKIDGEVFNLTKRAINLLAGISGYQNYKSVILGGQLILMAVSESSPFKGCGVDVISSALKLFSNGISSSQTILTAFEKTAKIYHMYFSNDFSTLLSVPDYQNDLDALEEATGIKRDFFHKNLRIPSEKRRNLINLLVLKIREDFKKETTLILSVLPSVIKIYKQIGDKKQGKLSYKQIKNAVTLGSYLTEKTSVLTLCRDEGILKCAN